MSCVCEIQVLSWYLRGHVILACPTPGSLNPLLQAWEFRWEHALQAEDQDDRLLIATAEGVQLTFHRLG